MISIVMEGHWGKLALGAGLATVASQMGHEHYKVAAGVHEPEAEKAKAAHKEELAKLDKLNKSKASLEQITKQEDAREAAKKKSDVAQEKQQSLESRKKWLGRGAIGAGIGAGAAAAKKLMPKKDNQMNQLQKTTGTI